MNKYTPGPWHWVNSSTDEPFDFNAQWDGIGYPSLRTVAEKDIDGLYTMPDFILTAEPLQEGNDLANARVIAAAPTLLMALEFLLDQAESFNVSGVYFNQFRENRDALDTARDAIAKATGAE